MSQNRYFDDPNEDDGVRTRSARPKDAATIILVRRDGSEPRVLMGKRSRGHDFMPDKFVFPGGRVDPQDGRVKTISELDETTLKPLSAGAKRNPRAFALTAIRETFEETGLILGRQADASLTGPQNWKPYFAEGAVPCLKRFTFVGRAVTPPYRPKRFDARFFMADAEDTLIDERPALPGAELVDVRWVGLDEALDLDLPSVTRFMIGEVGERLNKPGERHRPAYLRWTRNQHSLDRL